MKPKDSFSCTGQTIQKIPISKICRKLNANKGYCKKRENKALSKGLITTLEVTATQLKKELEALEIQQKAITTGKSQKELESLVRRYECF